MAMAKESLEPKKASSVEAEHSQHKLANLEIEIHRDGAGAVTGHTVRHHFLPKSTKSGAFSERPPAASYPFDGDGQSAQHGHILTHIGKHLGIEGPKGMIEAENKPGEADDEGTDGNAG